MCAFEIGTSDYSNSTGGFSFYNCAATLGNGANNKGWRLGTMKGVIGIFQISHGIIVSYGVCSVNTLLPDLLLMVTIHYYLPGRVVVVRCLINRYISKGVDLATSLDSVDQVTLTIFICHGLITWASMVEDSKPERNFYT